MVPISFAIFVIAVTATLLRNWKSLSTMYYCKKAVDSLPSLPKKTRLISGHLHLFDKDPLMFTVRMRQMLLEAAEKFKQKIAVLYFGIVPFPNFIHPDSAEKILRSSVQIEKPGVYQKSLPWLADGILLSTGQKWQRRRRMMTPAFHFHILDTYIDIMNKQAKILVDKLTEQKDQPDFDLGESLKLCTLDIICETAMGCQINAQSNVNHEYVQTLTKVALVNRMKGRSPLLNIDFFFNLSKYRKMMDQCIKNLHKFSGEIIAKRMENFDPTQSPLTNTSKRMAFMDILMRTQTEDGKYLSAQDVQEEVDSFLLAGHDTNATAILWTCYVLGRNPHAQKRVQEEVDLLFGDDDDYQVTSDDLRKIPYLEMVVKESLRLYPPASIIGRRIVEDCEIEGHKLPKGAEIYINIMTIHRLPEFWPDPTKFDPDRFTKDNCVGRHPYAYVPFSAGPRNCIGQRFAMQEQKILVVYLMRFFNIVSHTKEEDVKISNGIINQLCNFEGTLTRRQR